MDNRKVLIIGLDGATWKILNPLIEDGYMPNLKKIVQNGASGVLKSTKPPVTPVAWASFQTGCNPGKHGVFNFTGYDRENSKTFFVNSSFIKVPTIWDYLSSCGKKVIVLNVPLTYPVKEINGIMATGFPSPAKDSNFTFPKSFKDELETKVGSWILPKHSSRYRPHSDLKGFVNQMIKILENRYLTALYTMNEYEWDVFMIHFQCVDFIQHPYWKYLYKSHPFFNKEKYNYIASRFYKRLDTAVSEIKDTADKKTGRLLTILVSDHGFQSHKRKVAVNKYLYNQRYLRYFDIKSQRIESFIIRLIQKLDLSKIYKKIPFPSKGKLMGREFTNNLVGRRNSSAFALSSFWGYIYLNRPVAEELILDLKGLRDKGNAIIKKIYKKEELYWGKELKNSPDIIIEPEDGCTFLSRVLFQSSRLVRSVDCNREFQVGTHHEDGIFVCLGTDVKDIYTIPFKIWDIAPAILYYLGLQIPSYMDGKVPVGIFTDSFRNCNIPKRVNIEYNTFNKSDYSQREDYIIEKELKNLGYLQ